MSNIVEQDVISNDLISNDITNIVPDVVPDVVSDVVPDVVPDVVSDVVPDVIPDVVSDVVPDVVPDVVTDMVSDVVPDVVTDVVPDVITDINVINNTWSPVNDIKLLNQGRFKVIYNNNNNQYKYLNNIIYINLASRLDRNVRCLKQLVENGFNNIIRFDAICIPHIKSDKNCALSHLACVVYAKQNNFEFINICEDDILINKPNILKEHFNNLDKDNIDFNIVFNGIKAFGNGKRVNKYLCTVPYSHCLTLYTIHKKYYDECINYMIDGLKKNIPVDVVLLGKKNPKNKYYAFYPVTVSQKPDYSNISFTFEEHVDPFEINVVD